MIDTKNVEAVLFPGPMRDLLGQANLFPFVIPHDDRTKAAAETLANVGLLSREPVPNIYAATAPGRNVFNGFRHVYKMTEPANEKQGA